jgi:hypothetical protein
MIAKWFSKVGLANAVGATKQQLGVFRAHVRACGALASVAPIGQQGVQRALLQGHERCLHERAPCVFWFVHNVFICQAAVNSKMCDCKTHPLCAAVAAHDVRLVKGLLDAAIFPECTKCSMIDALHQPARRKSAVADCTFSADQACILGQLVGTGFTRTSGTSPHPGLNKLLTSLKSDEALTAAFIARENCRCGNQLASIISSSVSAVPSPNQLCQRC